MKKLLTSLSLLFILSWALGATLATEASTAAPTYEVEVVNTFPHDPKAFTQGLLYHQGFLYESTGLWEESSLRKVDLKSGKVLQMGRLDRRLFGEGLAKWNEQLVQLTWHAGKAIVYRLESFQFIKTFDYKGEGWGLTSDSEGFIQSNGSATLRFLNPINFQETRRIKVTDNGKAIEDLNELEFIRGEVFANVWQQSKIARIDPKTGHVTSWLDLSNLVPSKFRGSDNAVLNGIAYDAVNDRIFVTGKLWPKLYEIKIGKRKEP